MERGSINMRYGIVSDIHANIWALNSVLEHMDSVGVDSRVCLGDCVGYGPYPNECVETVINNFNFIIMGNHDNALFDKDELDGFSPQARYGIEWTLKNIKQPNIDFLKNLEYGYLTGDNILLVHGAPHAPFVYLNNFADAYNAFGNPISSFKTAFVGHTHVPEIWEQSSRHGKVEHVRIAFSGKENVIESLVHHLGDEYNDTAIINVGSVGQPRDGDIRACYAIYDTEDNKIEYYKIPYPVDRTIAKMQQAGFPPAHWSRLMYGE